MGLRADDPGQPRPRGAADLGRGSVLADPAVAALVADGIARDGSDTAFLATRESRLEGGVLTIDAAAARRVADVVGGRLPFGRSLTLDDARGEVRLGAGGLELPPAAVAELREVLRRPVGEHEVAGAPGLVVRIVG